MAETAEKVRVLSHYIDGSFVAPVNGAYLDDRAPATGDRIAQVPDGSAGDIDRAVAAAKSCFTRTWAGTSTAERAELCEMLARGIERRTDELAVLESQDTGKPIDLARQIDIPRAVANFRFFAGAIRHDETAMHEMPSAINYTLRRPLGVCALVTPWNLPLYLLTWKAAPALAMGNTIVAKPSELTPLTASALAEIFHEAGAPAGVFNLVHGSGNECGEALVAHPDVAAISFTGGTKTGARVAAVAAPSFKKLSLELGGKNPTVVFEDCDMEAALEGALQAGYRNQGQVCLCGSRLLVQRSLHEEFTDRFAERVRGLRVGDPSLPGVSLGALISEAHRDKVEGYLKLARQEGGQVIGGERPDLPPPCDRGSFLQPALVTGLSPSCRTAQEEIFGPVVTVHPFEDEEDAIAIANAVPYGLSASVWTRDLARAHRISARLQSGMVWVNTWMLRDLRVPFGGVKQSGVGREGGRYSLEFFSESRNVCVNMGET